MRPEEGSNQTEEDITAHYVELNKAYKALTDDEIRNNYLQYGHPDGKQSFSIGIALPTFLVADGYGKYTLAMYGALLGVLLPYIVGKWWYGSQRVTKEGVLVSSAGQLFQQWREDLARGGVITAVSHGDEYNHILKGNKADAGLGKVEKAILAEDASAAKLNVKDRLALQKMDGPKRKALALLWAYLGRIELNDPMLNDGESLVLLTESI
jgi:translocation protein SEC63